MGGTGPTNKHKDGCRAGRRVIPFRREGSYYARKGLYYDHRNQLSRALLFMQKAIEIEPENPRHHYNLACLLSRTSRLREANGIFRHIIRNLDPRLNECYYFLAVNHGLMEEPDQARHYLHQYLHRAPEGELAGEAEDLLLALEEEEWGELYNRRFSAEESGALLDLIEDLGAAPFGRRLLEDAGVRRILRRGLFHGSDLLRESVLKLYGRVGGAPCRTALEEFATNPWVGERLRQVALRELRRLDPRGRCRVFSEGRLQTVGLADCRPPAPLWREEWQRVLDCAFAGMGERGCYGREFFEDLEAIWRDYINRSYPRGPRVERPAAWAAALEYCLSRFHFLGITQRELAAAYKVSVSGLQRRFARLNGVLQIDRKAYRNMLTFLSCRDLE